MAGRGSRSRPPSRGTREFVAEAEEILERMRESLSELADADPSRKQVPPELLNELFRAAHSLKGLAGMSSLDEIGGLAHELEGVLDSLRLGRISLEPQTLSLLEAAVEAAVHLLEALANAEPPAGVRPEVQQLIERMGALGRSQIQPDDVDLSRVRLDPSLLRALTEYEEHRLRENLRSGQRIHLVEATFEILSFEQGLAELTAALRAAGELISTLPAPGAAPDAQIRFSLLVATELGAEELEARLGFSNATVQAAADPRQASLGAPREPVASREQPGRAAEWCEEPSGSPDPIEGLDSLRSISDTVRVATAKLDGLMNLVGELMIQRTAIGAIVGRLATDPGAAPIGNDLAKVHKVLDRKLRDLQTGISEVRMVPLRQVFERLARIVRRLRRQLGKEVRLEIRGADTELDKLMIEEVADPLMHVVRNAFDHAIETPEERIAAGKPPEGCIRIQAFQRGSHVVIEVADDGRGIDAEAVRSRGLALGLIEPDDALSSKELLQLIFAPGLSTRTHVTATSGRGVGMDVVRANLTRLGGAVEVDSVPGRGTSIAFTLPITLAIVQILLVTVAEQRFAIPLTSVLETLPLGPPHLPGRAHEDLINLRDEPLRLLRLADRLALRSTSPPAKQYVVVVGLGEARLGLVVDRLEDQQDAVMKPIQGPVARLPGIAGATELGDQEAVLVLDVAALLEEVGQPREAA